MSNYARILTRLTNTPLCMTSDKLITIADNVIMPMVLGQELGNTQLSGAGATQHKEISTETDVAVINVYDSLVARNGAAFSGLTSYESISNQIDSAVKAGIKNIGFRLDSPGGEATNAFALSRKIRELPAKHGVATFSYIEGSATSACYAIAAATQTIYSEELALAGSVAAVMVHLETSKQDAAEGKTYTIFRSKAEKALGDSHTALGEIATNHYTALLDNVDAIFNNDIVASRDNFTIKDLKGHKGRSYTMDEAVPLGFVDEIVPDFETALSAHLNLKQVKGITMTVATAVPVVTEGEQVVETAETPTVVAATETQGISAADLASAVQTGIADERLRISGITSACTALGLPESTGQAYIDRGTSLAEAKEHLTFLAEQAGTTTAIDAEVGSTAAPNAEAIEATGSAQKVTTLAGDYASATGTTIKKEGV